MSNVRCDYDLDVHDETDLESDLELTDVSLELEPVTEAQPLRPLELVEPVRVELVWPKRVTTREPFRATRLRTSPDRVQIPARPVPGQLWMGTPRVTPKQRRLRREKRAGLGRFVCAFLALFATQS